MRLMVYINVSFLPRMHKIFFKNILLLSNRQKEYWLSFIPIFSIEVLET